MEKLIVQSTVTVLVVIFIGMFFESIVSCDRYNTCMKSAKDVAACGKP